MWKDKYLSRKMTKTLYLYYRSIVEYHYTIYYIRALNAKCLIIVIAILLS